MKAKELEQLKQQLFVCKHCGAEPEIIQEQACYNEVFIISCKCGIQTKFDTWEKVLEIWNNKASKTKLDILLDNFPTTTEISDTFIIRWSEKGRGFGEYCFYIKDNKIHCDNECDNRETVKKILLNLVDNCIFDDE
jgi:hypothetical protein